MTFDLDKAKEDCQRHEDALEEAQSCMCGHCHTCGFDPVELKAALDEIERQAARIKELEGWLPAWKVTKERIEAIKDACNFLVYAEIRNEGVNPGNVNRAKNAGDVLRAMLKEAGRDA